MGRSNPQNDSIIKSIQRGYFEMSDGASDNTNVEVNTTISEVDLSKSHIYCNNSIHNSLGYGTWQNTLFSNTKTQHAIAYLTTSTNVYAVYNYRNFSNGHRNPYVAWQVIEYW